MKFSGWLYLGLMVTFQLIGWFGFGKANACQALMVIVIPSSILTGLAFFGFYYWNRLWVMIPPAVLLFTYLGLSHSNRTTPHSALLSHAMSEFLEKKINSFEDSLAGAFLFFGMLFIAMAVAFCSAEIYRLRTGRRERGGRALFRDASRSVDPWGKPEDGKEKP
ncbi:hypothetical protein [Prosthecobacter sp.]|uniref:hypothetical protein n=1 Tax=Prosthecobacter sp. TaxID=1965333 RepID=UPI0024884077|nr:hypothetical protein [Prosthecobacter sp.]MDI1314402.1 hypothetical protein [Prosthecobacter sp.]